MHPISAISVPRHAARDLINGTIAERLANIEIPRAMDGMAQESAWSYAHRVLPVGNKWRSCWGVAIHGSPGCRLVAGCARRTRACARRASSRPVRDEA